MIGHYIGMSQIIDDVLDSQVPSKKLCVWFGSDLLNGHITLLILLEMQKPDQTEKSNSYVVIVNAKNFDECIQIIRKSGQHDEAKSVSSSDK